MDKSEQYGYTYENFIRRAYRTNDRSKPGMDMSVMRNLGWAEEGRSSVSHLTSSENMLTILKTYIEKGLDKMLKFKLTPEEKQKLEVIKHTVPYCLSSRQLMDCINDAMDVTQRFKEY
jgi:hypothetical protein